VFLGAQKITTQAIDKPSEGKSLVYIINSGRNDFVYDGDEFISKIGISYTLRYNVYETEPGKHIFWKGINPSVFVEADLEPNSTYVLGMQENNDSIGGMFGAVGAIVESTVKSDSFIKMLNPTSYKDRKVFYSAIKSWKKKDFDDTDKPKNNEDIINKSMLEYQNFKENNKDKILVFSSSLKFENADKPVKD
jgi:hypothetical protein